MNKVKKFILIFITCLLPVFLTSCWDYTEIETLLTVLSLGIDKDIITNEYILTIEVVDIFPSTEDVLPFLVESRGKTIFEALRSFINITGKKNNLAHCECFIIGKSAINDGLVPLLDLIERDVEIRADSFIFLTNTFTASDLMKDSSDKGELISAQVIQYINSNGFNGEFTLTRAYEIVDKLEAEGVDPVISNIALESSQYEILNVIKGLYTFTNEKISGYLTPTETKFFNLLINNNLKSLFSISSPEGDYIVFELIRAHSNIKPKLVNNEIRMIITCELEGVISEIEGNSKNYLLKEERIKLLNLAEEQCKKDIEDLIYKIQNECNSDILGFGKKINQLYPNEWDNLKEDWYKEYPKIGCDIDVTINLRGSALRKSVIKGR